MYSLLPVAGAQGVAADSQLSLNVRASWVAGAPVLGDVLFTLCRPSQVLSPKAPICIYQLAYCTPGFHFVVAPDQSTLELSVSPR